MVVWVVFFSVSVCFVSFIHSGNGSEGGNKTFWDPAYSDNCITSCDNTNTWKNTCDVCRFFAIIMFCLSSFWGFYERSSWSGFTADRSTVYGYFNQYLLSARELFQVMGVKIVFY